MILSSSLKCESLLHAIIFGMSWQMQLNYGYLIFHS